MLLPDILQVLAINFGLCVAAFLVCWAIAVAIRDPTFVDSVWALGMGGLAVATLVQAWGTGRASTCWSASAAPGRCGSACTFSRAGAVTGPTGAMCG